MYRLSETVRSTHDQDGAIVLDIKRGRMLRLNVTASLIFERLRQGQGQSQIVEGVAQQFGISREIVRADVTEFLKLLEQQGLVDTKHVEIPSMTHETEGR